MDLRRVIADVADALVQVDSSRKPFRSFQPGVGPYGEPQLLKHVAEHLNRQPQYKASVITKKTPNLLIPHEWAIEFKIVRPYADNGKEAENWSVNLLHPYPGSASSISDCLKLKSLPVTERKAVAVIGYEHEPAKIRLDPLVQSFEAVCGAMGITISEKVEERRSGLVHPVHQVVRVFGWEVLDHNR